MFDGGAYADDSPAVLAFGLYMARGPYRIPMSGRGTLVYTNKLRAGAFRGFGNPQVTFAGELQIDEIANKLGIDPIELRCERHRARATTGRRANQSSPAAWSNALKKVRDRSGWNAAALTTAPPQDDAASASPSLAHICGVLGDRARSCGCWKTARRR